jgi:DnaK suppressor protein
MSTTSTRTATLRQGLLDRRRQLQSEIAERVRTNREAKSRDVGDMLDSSDADVQSGMEFTLLQMKTETLANIDRALTRVEAGQYGDCAECGDAIAERRLLAVPFAVRCHECEQRREVRAQRQRASTTMSFGATPSGSSFDISLR